MDNRLIALVVAAVVISLIPTAIFLASIPAMLQIWASGGRLNSKTGWTLVPQQGQTRAPIGVDLNQWFRGVIMPHLEAGETLEGHARGFFRPSLDVRIKSGLLGYLLVAVTPRRILLFDLSQRTVCRTCVIEHDDIEYLCPPQPGLWGTSGSLRFGLHSGREYQIEFVGPLLSAEGMGQEQNLAVYFRSIGPRFPSSRPDPFPRTQAAA
jgi:hypothetical protein